MDITTRVFESEEQHQEWLAWLKTEDLRGANLIGANLIGADLYGADLSDADLYRANLYRADLYRADLRDADLSGADLRDANLSDTNLRGADLYRANFEGAKINWQSHSLLSELLRRAAGEDLLKQAMAALIGTHTDWCWAVWMNDSAPEGCQKAHWDLLVSRPRNWALGVLTTYLKDDEAAPWLAVEDEEI